MKNAKEILKDPIKATLFGKFYEEIVLGWFKEKTGFAPFDGKPRIYWKDVESVKGGDESVSKLKDALKYALEKRKKEGHHCTPDGFLQKNGKFYIWEAKNWPLWPEPLTNCLYKMPQILAKKAFHKTKEYEVHGILFSWWSRPEGVESLKEEIKSLIEPRTFDIFFTAEILKECINEQYSWYLKIIQTEKERVDELFRNLKGDS
ncbi:MAG: hypothetical protein HQ591_04900 [candidate division Zixibacteria bacterium]|nr:hypothetical protein [Candidatus Tariuqbacter arcticus]